VTPLLAAVLCLLLAASPVLAETLSGTVERVKDGDTVRMRLLDGGKADIRLAGIDTPEKAQPFGRAAGRRLAALCLGKPAEAEWRDTDRFERPVGRLFCDGRDVGRVLIAEGLAWHFKRYARNQPFDERTGDSLSEAAARDGRLGLWSEPDPVPPWDWRKAAKAAKRGRRAGLRSIGSPLVSGAAEGWAKEGGGSNFEASTTTERLIWKSSA
jgi:endonuclease YncB( thermonuclease family)